MIYAYKSSGDDFALVDFYSETILCRHHEQMGFDSLGDYFSNMLEDIQKDRETFMITKEEYEFIKNNRKFFP